LGESNGFSSGRHNLKHQRTLQRRGLKVSHSFDKDSIEFYAEKKREKFIIEGIWETEPPDPKKITYAVGKTVKRMKERGFWIYYGIAIPKSYYRYLSEFEVTGFETLGLHLFLVESFYEVSHLDPKMATELMKDVKTGNITDEQVWSINYGL
jgi:hypothetical protein